ncbi:unnamed protein product [Durusdinium trenchii]|uniref:Uncharacterized protein n=1 Tax=Durusdinium trenchii TaxID=1381693 RepID=A0ABP0S942_9DINO
MARHLRRSPQLRSADAQLLLDVTKETTAAEAAARRLVQRRPEWFVAVLPGPFFGPCKDLFGEGFPIFAEIQVESEVISIFARNCVGDAVSVDAPYEIPPAENVKVLQHRAPSAAAKAAGGEAAAKAAAAAAEASPASTFYFELAEKLKYQVPTFVFWCEGRSLATACGANARAPEHLSLAVGSSCVELFFFHPDALPPAATPSPRGGGVAVSGQLILAPTGSGKSTWRSLAPIYCPEGEVMADVTFHPSYHKSIRLAPGAWLSSEGTAIFLRSLAQLIRWLRQDRRRRVTFNCTGQVLSKALELGILRPSDVVLVLPLEPIHRRNLQRRSAAEPVETNDQATSQPAKKFKRDSSLLDFDTGARINRETLLEAARQHQLRVVSSFTAAAPATRSYCFLRRDDATGRTLRDPGAKLRQAFDLTMPCGRRISNWVLKDGKVEEAENPSIWQISASADRDVEEGGLHCKDLERLPVAH